MLPVKLWVELFPVKRVKPQEFSYNKAYSLPELKVRQWAYFKVDELPHVMVQNIKCGTSTAMVAEIGQLEGQMPRQKCWWLNFDEVGMLEIEHLKEVASLLNLMEYPSTEKLFHARNIIDNLINKGKNRSF